MSELVAYEAGSQLAVPDDPDAFLAGMAKVATALKTMVKAQGLVVAIQGRDYPKVEAWTALGSLLGVFPVCTWTRRLPPDEAYGGGWEARVEARTKNGEVVGAAEAMCTYYEKNWKTRDDFALRSMAQTRATSKALRLPLGFVMTLAGFEPKTAAEDFRERRELQGLGDSDGLGSDPTLEPPSLALRDPLPDWKRAGLLRAQKAENDEHSFGL